MATKAMCDMMQEKEMERRLAQLRCELQEKELTIHSLLSQIVSIREEERGRMARGLHDETKQILASLNAHLQVMEDMLPADANEIKQLVVKCQQLIISVFSQLDILIYELNPIILNGQGIEASVESLAKRSLGATGIKVNITSSGQVKRLPSTVETELLRVAREVINNIVRHAHANTVEICLDFKKTCFRMQISDDGVGFDVEEAMSLRNGLRGFGLHSMRERLELLGGKIDIESSPNRGGTKIDVEVKF